MTLLEFPGNRGQIFAVDPVHVTGVNAFKGTLSGRGRQMFDMTVVWLDNHTSFICSWKMEHVLQVLNEARAPLEMAFRAGYRAGVKDIYSPTPLDNPEDIEAALNVWLRGAGR